MIDDSTLLIADFHRPIQIQCKQGITSAEQAEAPRKIVRPWSFFQMIMP